MNLDISVTAFHCECLAFVCETDKIQPKLGKSTCETKLGKSTRETYTCKTIRHKMDQT